MKMLIYWSVPDFLSRDTRNRKPDPIHWSFGCSHSHTSPTRESCQTQTSFYFLFQPSPELSFVFHRCINFWYKCFLAFCKYDTKGWDLRPGGGLPFWSSLSKPLTSICKLAEHCWYAYKMAANPPTIPKRLTCKWRLGYFPSLQTQLNHVLTDGGQSKTDLHHLRMCRVRTRSKREASLQNLTQKTSHMLRESAAVLRANLGQITYF